MHFPAKIVLLVAMLVVSLWVGEAFRVPTSLIAASGKKLASFSGKSVKSLIPFPRQSLARFSTIEGGASASGVKHANSLPEFNRILSAAGDKLVAVDFTASWCGPCKVISPVFSELANKYSGVTFVKVDVDEASDVAQAYQIRSMPTFLFIKEGKVVSQFSGADPQRLRTTIENLSK